MSAAIPFVLFCLAVLAIGLLRAPRRDEPLPTLNEVGAKVLRIQAIGFAIAVGVAFFADNEVAVVVFLVAQGFAALSLLVHGLNVLLARR